MGIVFLELCVVVDRRGATCQTTARIGKIQVARVDAFLLVNLPSVVVAEVRIKLTILRLPVRIRVRRIDLTDSLLNVGLLLRVGLIRCVGCFVRGTDWSSP